MLVRHRMTANPITISPQDTLATAKEQMTKGKFRRLPVVQDDVLVGIVTDRDILRFVGSEERTRVNGAMTESPLTISPTTPVEEAVRLLRKHRINGLPVVENGKVIGIITTSDIMQAFLEVSGASVQGSVRIDLLQTKDAGDLTEAANVMKQAGGEVLSVGTYKDPWSEQPIFYLRARSIEPGTAKTVLEKKGYTVLSVQ
ncbi:MAG: CBS domain-containing protein [Deltaproteobacteria bacterium]|nr:CBS domain-containing protein [Deltaproteobacteria bacterium]